VVSTQEERMAGFTCAGLIADRGLNLLPMAPPVGRLRHVYGEGPFAKLVMPPLPPLPSIYAWELDTEIVYIGQTTTPLRQRLGSNGYATTSNYNTLAREPGRKNGGQQTNCQVNALANQALVDGRRSDRSSARSGCT
jgi:hypothetical protein